MRCTEGRLKVNLPKRVRDAAEANVKRGGQRRRHLAPGASTSAAHSSEAVKTEAEVKAEAEIVN